MRLHSLAHRFAQRLDIRCAGAAKIDKKIAVQLRYLRATDGQTAAPGIVNQFPGTVAGWIFEGRTASAIARLARFALLLDCRHLRSDLVRHACATLQNCRCECHVIGHRAVTVRKSHVAVAESMDVSL